MTERPAPQPAPSLHTDQTFRQAVAHHRAGQLPDAERLYRAILRVQPGHPDANHNLGVLAVQAGRLAEGLPYLNAALAADPATEQYWLSYIDALIQAGQTDSAQQVLQLGQQHGLQGEAVDGLARRLEEGPSTDELNTLGTLFNQKLFPAMETAARRLTRRFPHNGNGWKALGAALQEQGRIIEALDPLQRATELLPGDAETHYNLGNALMEQGYFAGAEASYRRALEISPDFAKAHNNLGNTLREQGYPSEAEASYRLALSFSPYWAEAHNNLGIALKEQRRLSEAEASLHRALEIKPDYAEAHSNLGILLKDQSRLAEAEASLRQALAIKPDYAEAHSNLGILLKDQGRLIEAEASLRQALAIKPDCAEAHNNLGVTLKDLGRLTEAETSLRRALEIKPDYAEAHNNLGATFTNQGRLAEAEASLRRALEIKQDYATAHDSLGNTLKDQGRLTEAEASLRRALEIKPDNARAYSDLLFTLNYTDSHSPSCCVEEARRYGSMVAKKVAARFSAWRCAPQPDCLRVGMVSGDLRNHPVGYFLEGLLARLDPARVELVAYPTRRKEDQLAARIRPRFAAWKPLVGLSDEATARMIHADGVHILLDLSGHTAYNRLPVFAWKPAPVQCTWLGYFATTGVAEMDYVLVDQMGVPEVQRQQFTETVWYLPDTRLCFTAPEVGLPVAPSPALANGHITFGCFQNLSKIGDRVLALWGTILAALPKSRLRLQCRQLGDVAVAEDFRQRLIRHGIEPARVAMYSGVSRDAYLAAHAEVDLILDTFPYPGGTTTCEALWMGVPTLTLAGDSLLARQGASLLAAAGLTEWVATSQPDYVAKAIALACDLPKLAALRKGLREQVLISPLFDASRFARNFEDALWKMWRCWQACQGGSA